MTVTEETMIHDFDPAAKAFTNHMKVLDNAFFDGHAGDEGTGPRLLVMLDRDMPTSEVLLTTTCLRVICFAIGCFSL